MSPNNFLFKGSCPHTATLGRAGLPGIPKVTQVRGHAQDASHPHSLVLFTKTDHLGEDHPCLSQGGPCAESTVSLQIHVYLEPQIVTLLGNRVFADIISNEDKVVRDESGL